MDQNELLDKHLYKVIKKCYVKIRDHRRNEIFVIYDDGSREAIWSYDPTKYDFEHREFLGKRKIEAVFYCDRKPSRNVQLL